MTPQENNTLEEIKSICHDTHDKVTVINTTLFGPNNKGGIVEKVEAHDRFMWKALGAVGVVVALIECAHLAFGR